jgi:flavodoxin
LDSKSLLIVRSYHHRNTEKIAQAMARVLDAQVKTPDQVQPEELQQFDLIGFGSGIYDEKHHTDLLDLVDRLPPVTNGRAFIFSTFGVPAGSMADSAREFHTPLRDRLHSKGYRIVGEFGCRGLNTNAFLKWFGGLNKGRPNAEDVRHAEEFARSLIA